MSIHSVNESPQAVHDRPDDDKDAAHIERVLSGTTDPDLSKDHVNYDRIDRELAQYTSDTVIDISEETNARLRHLINKRVLTIMVVTYFLQTLDKGTLSFASIMGITTDTHLHGTQYSWLTTCIYIAVLIVEYPTNWIIQHVSIAKYMGANIMLWGATLACHAACKTFPQLLVARTFLGIFEAVCQPAFLVISSMWYKREEQAQTVAYWYMMNGGQQIVGGLLAYCFSLIKPDGVLKSWQALFVTYGCISVLWGGFVLFWMPDSPMRAKCFSEEDKKLMVERVRSNQTGMQNRKVRIEQVWEAFRDPQMYCHMLIAICTTIPTSGLGAFYAIVIKGFGFTVLQTQLLAMVLGVVIIATLISSAWFVKKTGQNCLVMGAYVIPCIIGTVVLMTVTPHNTASRAGLLVSYYIVFTFFASQTLSMSMITRNIAGQTKKTVVIAANFCAWCAGNSIGPQIFLSWDGPRYFIAFSTHMACYVLLLCTIVFLRWWLRQQNTAKDALAEVGVQEANDERLVHAWEDLTDRENASFRYVY